MSYGVLASHELVAGVCCYFRAADGRFLAFTQRAGFHLSWTGGRAWFEVAQTDDARLLFRCAHGPYLCACPDSGVAAAHTPAAWETFTPWMTQDSRLCLRSYHGGYI